MVHSQNAMYGHVLVPTAVGTGIFGHKARFAFRVCLRIRRFILCTNQKLAGTGPGFDSKSDQLTSITIQADPRQLTFGPVLTPLLMRSAKAPDTLWWPGSLITGMPGPITFFEKPRAATIGGAIPSEVLSNVFFS